MDKVKEAWGKIQGGWQAMDKSKRTRLIVILAAMILVIGSLTYVTNKVDYSVLFSDMEPADAGIIVEDLEAQGVDYKLEDNGSTILIDSGLVDKYRIELAVNDMVPENTIGFEIFDSASMMATDDDRSIMYQRAVQGELERAITALDSVEKAQVLLSVPEDSVFVDQENRAEASASVVITPRTSSVSASEIQGIASLIGGAVDNLPIENIKIVDTNGNLLSSALGSEGLNSADITSQYRQMEASYEEELVVKLREVLGPIYGMENLTISVNSDLNFDAVEEESVDYDPNYIDETNFETEGPVVRSESVQTGGSVTIDEDTSGNGNVSNVIPNGEADDGSTYNRTVNNEVDTKKTYRVKAPGEVVALTTSIVFNGNLNFEQEDQLRQIAANAIGAQQEDIVIQGIPFATAEEAPPVPIGADIQEKVIEALKNNWPYAVGGIVIIVLLLLLVKMLKRRRDYDEFDDLYDEAETDDIVQSQAAEAEIAKKAAEQEQVNLKEQLNKTMTDKENKVKTMAKDNPEMAADLIKIWMKEE